MLIFKVVNAVVVVGLDSVKVVVGVVTDMPLVVVFPFVNVATVGLFVAAVLIAVVTIVVGVGEFVVVLFFVDVMAVSCPPPAVVLVVVIVVDVTMTGVVVAGLGVVAGRVVAVVVVFEVAMVVALGLVVGAIVGILKPGAVSPASAVTKDM